MKKFILLLFIAYGSANAQVMGDIATDGRAITTNKEYELESDTSGIMVFDIAVNMDGKVTGCTYNSEKSNLRSTPLMISGKNRILKGLSFEVGYAFPKHHQGSVQINVVKKPEDPKKKKKKK